MVNLSPPMHEPFAIALYLAMCNVIEVLLAAYLLHGRISARTGFSRPRQLIYLFAYGVIVAPGLFHFLHR